MKVYLSSYNLGDHPDRLTSLIGARRSAAVIINAGDVWPEYKLRVPVFLSDLRRLGLNPEVLDLRDFFGEVDRLRIVLDRVGLVWATGGNTFVLRRAMRLSGFDRVISDGLRTTDLVYGGFSAGACVASPTLKGIHLADEPSAQPPGYPAEIVWDGLGLIDFYIAPHYRSNHLESEMMEDVVRYYREHSLACETLVDGEVLLIDNGETHRIK